MRSFVPVLSAIALSIPASRAFQAPGSTRVVTASRLDSRRAGATAGILSLSKVDDDDDDDADADTSGPTSTSASAVRRRLSPLERSVAASLAAAAAAVVVVVSGTAMPAGAVSGGGLDYAGLDLSGQDFSNSDSYKGKDFTQTIAKAANFANSNLQGCRFYKAYLVNTNFEGADVRGVSFEGTSMDGANLRNMNAAGAYFGQSLLDVESLEGGDFTDAQIPDKTLLQVCEREDVKGKNPTTGADTRDSLMCL